jgi:hypothetical protein
MMRPKSVLIALTAAFVSTLACDDPDASSQPVLEFRDANSKVPVGYEVWGSDQSNSVPGEDERGVNGSWIWIWDGEDVVAQIETGEPAPALACAGMEATQGPCDANEVFPASLLEYDVDGNPTGETRPQIGRLHGMLVDPQDMYLTANFFAPGGGFVGIIDGRTKAAVALFRASATSAGRSNHMSFWTHDGHSIIVANLAGKILERIDVTRDLAGNIVDVEFVEGAGLGVGQGMAILDRPKVYLGANLAGEPMKGTIVAGLPDTDDLTPNGMCRENGCAAGPDGAAGGRPNNLIICPIPSQQTNHAFLTLAGGGLLVVDHSTTPMSIVGEYGNAVINGAGCGGVEGEGEIFINAGISASAAGATQSTFTVYGLPLEFGDWPNVNAENVPAPEILIEDPNNTATNGCLEGQPSDLSGQLPGQTDRRDSHGMVRTPNGAYVHIVDRIQNLIEVIHSAPQSKHSATYDLLSADGQGGGVGPCEDVSVPGLPSNDPAPDLMDVDPNGRYLFVAFRGPVPVSVSHSAQGSCPGVGVVELENYGKRGHLVTVLRSTNTIDTVEAGAAYSPGGYEYEGPERSDIHAAAVRRKVEEP